SRCRAPISTAVTAEAARGVVFLDVDASDLCVLIHLLQSGDHTGQLQHIIIAISNDGDDTANLFTVVRGAEQHMAGW
ncbi:MAG: hypothetical protein AABZ17_00050, partial [Nitrospirota bacterium]